MLAPRTVLQLAALLFLTVASVGEDVPSDEQIALRLAPAHVVKEIAKWPGDSLRVAVERVDLDRSGSPGYLVAAYAAIEDGALRVIRLAREPAVVADAPERMGGVTARLGIVDVDGDGTPEVAAYFNHGRGPSSMFVYRWAKGGLRLLWQDAEAVFEDLDGDGKCEAIGGVSRGAERVQPVHALSGGKFVRAGGLLLYTWAAAKLGAEEDGFEIVAGAPADGVLRVRNGDGAGGHRVRAAEVVFNGVVVLNAGDLVSSRFAEAKVRLQEKNEIQIRIFEPADGELLVWVPQPEGITAAKLD